MSTINPSELDLLEESVIKINRTAKVTSRGKRFRFSALVAVGDGKGHIGIGLGKANEVTEAITKAIDEGKKNLVQVPIYNGTIPHEQESTFSGARVFMKPASSGTGVIAGGAMRAVLESAGVKNVLAKSKGSSNPHNVVKATMLALKELRSPLVVAHNRGVKLEKVFNG